MGLAQVQTENSKQQKSKSKGKKKKNQKNKSNFTKLTKFLDQTEVKFAKMADKIEEKVTNRIEEFEKILTDFENASNEKVDTVRLKTHLAKMDFQDFAKDLRKVFEKVNTQFREKIIKH